jgi:hypothetical protein
MLGNESFALFQGTVALWKPKSFKCLVLQIDVNGQAEAPLYKFLKNSKGGGMSGDSIQWNFAKFLVNKQGQVVERYEPTTSPLAFEVKSLCLYPFYLLFLVHSKCPLICPLGYVLEACNVFLFTFC